LLIASLLMLLAAPAASALGAASVRFVNAVPGRGAAQLDVREGGNRHRIATGIAFGEIGGYTSVPAGNAIFEARTADGRSITVGRERIEDGARYTAVSIGDGQATIALIRDGAPRGGRARLRVVHAAPELGNVGVRVGGRRFARALGYQSVARYRGVDPGIYPVAVTRPRGGRPIASRGGVSLAAGTSSTAFVVGTRGEPVRVVVAPDGAAAPAGAPATGLGGMAEGGTNLLAALLAGLIAAVLGSAAYVALTVRPRGDDL
jgi:hypothetical protein